MITLQPITIKFEHIEEFNIESYLEWCEDQEIQPSQKHYKKWAIDSLTSGLMDNINTNKLEFIYGNSEEIFS